MNERHNEQFGSADIEPEYDVGEIVGELKRMVSFYGHYSESLKVGSDGRILLLSRNGDQAPAFLPVLAARDGHGPSIDEMYGVLKDVADRLPGYTVSINEDRTAGSFEYRISKKEA